MVSGSAPAGPLAGTVLRVWTRKYDGSRHGRSCSLVPKSAPSEQVTLGSGPDLDGLGWPEGLHCGPDLRYIRPDGQPVSFYLSGIHPPNAEADALGEDAYVHVDAEGHAYLTKDLLDFNAYAWAAAAESQARATVDGDEKVSRTLPGPDDAWNLRWAHTERILRDRGRGFRAFDEQLLSAPAYDDLREFAAQTERLRTKFRDRVQVEVQNAGTAVLRMGRLSEALAADACLGHYHARHPGPRFKHLRDAARDVLAGWPTGDSSGASRGPGQRAERQRERGELHWMFSNALQSALFAGGQQGFPYFWLVSVSEDPDACDDVDTIVKYLEGWNIGSFPIKNWNDRHVLASDAVLALRVLGEVTAAYRSQLSRVAATSPTWVTVGTGSWYGDWSGCVRAAVRPRRVAVELAVGGKETTFDVTAVPEHALSGYADPMFILGQVESRAQGATVHADDGRSLVEMVAARLEQDQAVRRELSVSGLTEDLARRLAHDVGLDPDRRAGGGVGDEEW
jgi:hypothetical protein